MKGWTLDDISWQRFEPGKVDPGLVPAIKAAALVEHNGHDYETYLHNVFADDAEFRDAVSVWAGEEVRHGKALAEWARRADAGFDFEARFARFRDGYRLPLGATRSVRGSRSGELIARCVVEAGTSTFYTAIGNASDEPVLKELCRLIAADEFRHYKLFYDTLGRYLETEPIGRARRLWVAVGRVVETEDDELPFAYYCANDIPGPYRRQDCARAYQRRVGAVYRQPQLGRAFGMVLKAGGVRPQGWLGRNLSRLAWYAVRWRSDAPAAAG